MTVALLCLTAALAHVGIEEPPPRYPSDGYGNNKSCPCGVGTNDTMCSDPSGRSDPSRDPSRVTTYEAGQQIVVVAHEVIGHSGRWRIAFDADGADLDDFNAQILLDVEDPPGDQGNVGQGVRWEFPITLPSTPCDNCTLQLIQVMNGNTTDPVDDPTGHSTYYQCADLVLTDPGTPTTTPFEPADTAVPTPTTPTGPTTGTSTSPTTPTAPTAGDTAAANDDKGCGCQLTAAPSHGLLLALPLAWARRRRVSPRRP